VVENGLKKINKLEGSSVVNLIQKNYKIIKMDEHEHFFEHLFFINYINYINFSLNLFLNFRLWFPITLI